MRRVGTHIPGMTGMDKLAEARIRDWVQRGRPRTGHEVDVPSLETQLLQEIVDLRKKAKAALDPQERSEALGRARSLRTQLVVLLEQTGRPLAARGVDRLLMDVERDL